MIEIEKILVEHVLIERFGEIILSLRDVISKSKEALYIINDLFFNTGIRGSK